MKNIRSVAARAAAGAAAVSVLLGSVAGAAATQGSGAKGDIDLAVPAGATLAVGGSSFSAPLYTYFTTSSSAGAYKPTHSVTFGTDSAAGSGDGRTKVTAGTYTIGMSDQPMDATAGTLPSGTTAAQLVNYVQIPWALGGAVVGYHLAGLNNLKLSASVITQIYNGKITDWNDAQIAALNPSVTLPNKTILVCYRNASSGTARPSLSTAICIAVWVITCSSACPAIDLRISGVGSILPPNIRVTLANCRRYASCTSGNSIFTPPTVATDVSRPTLRITSPTPHSRNTPTSSAKNSLATQESR